MSQHTTKTQHDNQDKEDSRSRTTVETVLTPQTAPAVALQRLRSSSPAGNSPADLIAAQRTVGNQAVQRMLQGSSSSEGSRIQRGFGDLFKRKPPKTQTRPRANRGVGGEQYQPRTRPRAMVGGKLDLPDNVSKPKELSDALDGPASPLFLLT